MSEELVKIGTPVDSEVAAFDPMASCGLEDVARLRPTNLVLLQNTTRDTKGGNPGQILDVLTEQCYDKLNVVALKVGRKRVMFPPGESLDAKPLCRSNDGKVPSPYVETPQSRLCATCPHSQWINGQRPACDGKMEFLLIIRSATRGGEETDDLYGLPRRFSVGGKSIKAAQVRMEQIMQDIQMSAMKAKRGNGVKTALFDYSFDISSEKVVSKKGAFYVVKFDKVARIKNVNEFGPLFEEYVLRANYREEDEEAVHAEQAVDAAVGQVVDAEFVEPSTEGI